MIARFFEDDSANLELLHKNPRGSVLNVRKSPSSGYAVVHSAHCKLIRSERVKTGVYTERGYRKFCEISIPGLSDWITSRMNSTATFPKRCSCVVE